MTAADDFSDALSRRVIRIPVAATLTLVLFNGIGGEAVSPAADFTLFLFVYGATAFVATALDLARLAAAAAVRRGQGGRR